MKSEGWFLRSDTGACFPVHDHRLWIALPDNARRVGVPERVIAQFPEWVWHGRAAFLWWLFEQCPHLIRVREHGVFYSFELWRVNKHAIRSIRAFCENCGVGDVVLLVIKEVRPQGRL